MPVFRMVSLQEDDLVRVVAEGGEVVGGEEDGQVIILADLVQHVQHQVLAPHIHPDRDSSSRMRIWGMGSRAMASEDPLELPAGEGADALVEQSLPMDPSQAALHPLPQVGGDGEEHRPAADGGGEEVQDADGVPRSKLGLWGT